MGRLEFLKDISVRTSNTPGVTILHRKVWLCGSGTASKESDAVSVLVLEVVVVETEIEHLTKAYHTNCTFPKTGRIS